MNERRCRRRWFAFDAKRRGLVIARDRAGHGVQDVREGYLDGKVL